MRLVPSKTSAVKYPQWLRGPDTIPWEDARRRLSEARNYWITSMRPDGFPHARPVWGVCTEEALTLSPGGGYWTMRNLRASPKVSVHPEPAEGLVVVVDAVAVPFEDVDRRARAVAAYGEKYSEPQEDGPAWLEFRPVRAYAWDAGGESFRGTRYRF